MPKQRTDVWASGDAYEPYVGRWSRLVARDFLDWLGVGIGKRWLDIGCGTGVAGLALRHCGFVAIDGIDISPEMLQQASTKQHDGTAVYSNLIEADLTQPLAIATGTYAGAVSTGTFTHGHVGPAALAEVVRILRPGAIAAIGINAAHFSAFDFGPTLDQLVDAGRISGLQLIDVPIYADAESGDPDQTGHVAVFTVT